MSADFFIENLADADLAYYLRKIVTVQQAIAASNLFNAE